MVVLLKGETMKVYVVVGIAQGDIVSITGTTDIEAGGMELFRVKGELGIVIEEESENSAELHEIEVEVSPLSVEIRRRVW